MSQLQGIRVLGLGTVITTPLAGLMLADLGADVIEAERPQGGDTFRSCRCGLYSPYLPACNRNKRSLTLDLRRPEGKRGDGGFKAQVQRVGDDAERNRKTLAKTVRRDASSQGSCADGC